MIPSVVGSQYLFSCIIDRCARACAATASLTFLHSQCRHKRIVQKPSSPTSHSIIHGAMSTGSFEERADELEEAFSTRVNAMKKLSELKKFAGLFLSAQDVEEALDDEESPHHGMKKAIEVKVKQYKEDIFGQAFSKVKAKAKDLLDAEVLDGCEDDEAVGPKKAMMLKIFEKVLVDGPWRGPEKEVAPPDSKKARTAITVDAASVTSGNASAKVVSFGAEEMTALLTALGVDKKYTFYQPGALEGAPEAYLATALKVFVAPDAPWMQPRGDGKGSFEKYVCITADLAGEPFPVSCKPGMVKTLCAAAKINRDACVVVSGIKGRSWTSERGGGRELEVEVGFTFVRAPGLDDLFCRITVQFTSIKDVGVAENKILYVRGELRNLHRGSERQHLADLVGPDTDGGYLVPIVLWGTTSKLVQEGALLEFRGVTRNLKYRNVSVSESAEVKVWIQSGLTFPANPLKTIWS